LARKGDKLISAEIVDYKTDALASPALLPELIEFYRPQLEAYKRAAQKITSLPADSVTARLVFLSLDEVVPV
jgi:ATP-dependent exoDNAse (exonuclease V) beta subunit